jgi:DNA-binding SARP family transcriptional activator
LGRLRRGAGGAPLQVGGPRERRTLVALLLHANRVVGVDQLVNVLWVDRPPRTADTQIRNTVATLRRNLSTGRDGHVPIRRSHGGFVADVADGELDLLQFERQVRRGRLLVDEGKLLAAAAALRSAAQLWRGPALGGLGAPVLDAEANALKEQRLTCVELRIEVESSRTPSNSRSSTASTSP